MVTSITGPSGANSSPTVTKLGQSHPWPQGTRWLNFGRSRSKVKVGGGGICTLLNALLVTYVTTMSHINTSHHMHMVYRCGLLLRKSPVAWSVCLSVCWEHGWAVGENDWIDIVASWGSDSHGSKQIGIRWGSHSPMGGDTFEGGHTQAIVISCAKMAKLIEMQCGWAQKSLPSKQMRSPQCEVTWLQCGLFSIALKKLNLTTQNWTRN